MADEEINTFHRYSVNNYLYGFAKRKKIVHLRSSIIDQYKNTIRLDIIHKHTDKIR